VRQTPYIQVQDAEFVPFLDADAGQVMGQAGRESCPTVRRHGKEDVGRRHEASFTVGPKVAISGVCGSGGQVTDAEVIKSGQRLTP